MHISAGSLLDCRCQWTR